VPETPFTRAVSGGLPVLRWPAIDAAGVDAVVTMRSGGASEGPYATLNLGLHVGDSPDAVLENRRRAAAAVGLSLEDLVFCKQAHGREVAVVGFDDRGRGCKSDDEAIADTDALVTASPGVGLVVMVADCVPIVLVDPVARVLSCIHAGWRGTTARVVDATMDRMEALGGEPRRVVAALGPAIPADRYQVGDDVVSAARDSFGTATDRFVRPDGTGRWLFDTWGANAHILVERGVPDQQISVADIGTGGDEFFSDRSERPCGRFAAIACLRS
jgi:YfiH family protein